MAGEFKATLIKFKTAISFPVEHPTRPLCILRTGLPSTGRHQMWTFWRWSSLRWLTCTLEASTDGADRSSSKWRRGMAARRAIIASVPVRCSLSPPNHPPLGAQYLHWIVNGRDFHLKYTWGQACYVWVTRATAQRIAGLLTNLRLLISIFQASILALNRRRGDTHKLDRKTVLTFNTSLQCAKRLLSSLRLNRSA